MWKFIKAPHRVLGRGIGAILALAACAFMAPAPSQAAVQYEKVCSLYGAGFFYIPGTDTCASANQTVQDQFAIARQLTRASTGTAMAPRW
jgi:Porin subfamily